MRLIDTIDFLWNRHIRAYLSCSTDAKAALDLFGCWHLETMTKTRQDYNFIIFNRRNVFLFITILWCQSSIHKLSSKHSVFLPKFRYINDDRNSTMNTTETFSNLIYFSRNKWNYQANKRSNMRQKIFSKLNPKMMNTSDMTRTYIG